MQKDMKDFLSVDKEKISAITNLKLEYLHDRISLEEAKKKIEREFDTISPEEFASSEQELKEMGFTDDEVHAKMDELLTLFDSRISHPKLDLPKDHPIATYLKENAAVKLLLEEMEEFESEKFIKNQWLEFYEQLSQFNIHLSRKQNQLFSMLETKGFDRPSKIMWSFDNAVRDVISKGMKLLKDDNIDEFLSLQNEVRELTLDIIDKEERILYPTSIKLISEDEFKNMRKGDDEIGYCLIEKPTAFLPDTSSEAKDDSSAFMQDLSKLLIQHGLQGQSDKDSILDVAEGKLTLNQINLIYKHLPMDLSYVDENEIVKFYSDTVHRVFPRSANVIGRDVKNCHPRESVGTVIEIIDAFRKGLQSQAEFWLEIGGKFIYIIYIAIRDENNVFRGVLEMMQDVTHIRSLTGSQRLLSWDKDLNDNDESATNNTTDTNAYGITAESLIGDVVEKYPYIKDFMPTISQKYNKILNPLLFKTIKNVATLSLIAERGGFSTDELINKIVERIDAENK